MNCTKLGFAFDEALSALQKEIRRGNTLSAVGFALDATRSGGAIHIVRRLKVIMSEDVGLADANLPATLSPLMPQIEAAIWKQKSLSNDKNPKRKKQEDIGKIAEELKMLEEEIEQLIIKATILLAEAEKSRLIDYIAILFYRCTERAAEHREIHGDEEGVAKKKTKMERLIVEEGDPKEIVEYGAQFWAALKENDEWRALYWLSVIDSLTLSCNPRPAKSKAGESRRAGNVIWQILFRYLEKKKEKEKEEREKEEEEEEEEEDKEKERNEMEVLKALQTIYRDRREGCLHIINAVLRVLRRKESYLDYTSTSERGDDVWQSLRGKRIHLVAEYEGEREKEDETEELRKEKEKEKEEEGDVVTLVVKMPDYAVDKHTRRGKAMGRGLAYFFEVGAILKNCKEGISDPYSELAMKWTLEREKEEEEKKRSDKEKLN